MIAIFLLFFAYVPASKSIQYKHILDHSSTFFAGSIAILSILGIALQYTMVDLKLPPFDVTLLWIMKMLFFTVIPEEFFFRFFIQTTLIAALEKFRYGAIIGLVISSLLFGLSHYAGGINFVLLASLFGLLYGGAYFRTKYLETTVILHFAVNIAHFFFSLYLHYSK